MRWMRGTGIGLLALGAMAGACGGDDPLRRRPHDDGGAAGMSGSAATTGGTSMGGSATGGVATGGVPTSGVGGETAALGGASLTGGAPLTGGMAGSSGSAGSGGTGGVAGSGGAPGGTAGASGNGGEGGSPCLDRDGDTICDAVDNCPDHANPLQENTDTDSYGDACDDCDAVDNPDQQNSDADSWGDLCDNCPFVTNEDQADTHSITARAVTHAPEPPDTDVWTWTYWYEDVCLPDDWRGGDGFEFFGVPDRCFHLSRGFATFDDCMYGCNYCDPGRPFALPCYDTTGPERAPEALISLAWTQAFSGSAGIYHQVLGTAPNRVFVLDVNDPDLFYDTVTVGGAVQLKLFEATSAIEVHATNLPAQFEYTMGVQSFPDRTGTAPTGWAAFLPGQNPLTSGLSNQAVRYTTGRTGPDGIGDACSNATNVTAASCVDAVCE